jgi:spore germination protein
MIFMDNDQNSRIAGEHPEGEIHSPGDEIREENNIRRARSKAKNVVIALLALTTLFGAYQYQRAVLLRRQLDAQYNRAFYELTGYVRNVGVLLSKATLTSSSQMTAKILEDVWHQAELISTNLAQLPVGQGALNNTQKFISQVGDYAQTINYKSVKGGTLGAEEAKTLEGLRKFAIELEKNLNALQGELSSGNLKWENLGGDGAKLFNKASAEMPKTLSKIDNSFQEMPTLIYDGPFSEHMSKQKALGLTGTKISDNQAIESLAKLFGNDNIRNVTKLADNKNGVIDTYNMRFELRGKQDYSVAEADVSVIGGKVVWFLYNRDVGDKKIEIDKAKEIGKQFLEKSGFKNMRDTYYTEHQGVATINYAYSDNGVTIYPDLVKVKVALDNGEVVGFESKGYLMSHRDRDIPKPAISEAEALQKVARKDDIKSSGLAIIPTDFGTELFVYEFKGKLNDQDFLVYINAMTGEEEDVLLIINSDEGVLTM